MLKQCPSCAYVGNDDEHVCRWCKETLAPGRPRKTADAGGPRSVRSSSGKLDLTTRLIACFHSPETALADSPSLAMAFAPEAL